jgi:hypothetical protein
MPEAIADSLELEEPWMAFYLNAFFQLSTCRRDSKSPIPWDAIDTYATRYRVTGQDYAVFLKTIRKMEQEFKPDGKSKEV